MPSSASGRTTYCDNQDHAGSHLQKEEVVFCGCLKGNRCMLVHPLTCHLVRAGINCRCHSAVQSGEQPGLLLILFAAVSQSIPARHLTVLTECRFVYMWHKWIRFLRVLCKARDRHERTVTVSQQQGFSPPGRLQTFRLSNHQLYEPAGAWSFLAMLACFKRSP